MAYDFHHFETTLKLWKERDKSMRRLSFEAAMERIRTEIEGRFSGYDARRKLNTIDVEEDWHRSGSPYYKIWPRMAAELADVEIDIPGSFLHLPYHAYSVRLSTADCPLHREENLALRSLLVGKADPLPDRGEDWRLMVLAQYTERPGEFGGEDGTTWSFGLPIGRESLEVVIEKEHGLWNAVQPPADDMGRRHKNGIVKFNRNHVQQVVRLAIAVAFFGLNNHEVIMPDLPRRLVERYHAARRDKQESEASKVLREARASGMFGWKVGSEIDLPPAEVRYRDKDRDGEGEGQHLTHGYVRRAHMRLQPKGPRDNPRHELTFVRSHLVRPDLPLREQHGYRIRMPQEVK